MQTSTMSSSKNLALQILSGIQENAIRPLSFFRKYDRQSCHRVAIHNFYARPCELLQRKVIRYAHTIVVDGNAMTGENVNNYLQIIL